MNKNNTTPMNMLGNIISDYIKMVKNEEADLEKLSNEDLAVLQVLAWIGKEIIEHFIPMEIEMIEEIHGAGLMNAKLHKHYNEDGTIKSISFEGFIQNNN